MTIEILVTKVCKAEVDADNEEEAVECFKNGEYEINWVDEDPVEVKLSGTFVDGEFEQYFEDEVE